MNCLIAFSCALVPVAAHAKTTLTKAASADDESHLAVEIELRPSWNPSEKHTYSFNYGELGYQINANTYLGYQQRFINEFSQDPASPANAPFHVSDGYLHARLDKLWVEPTEKQLSLSLEPRVYAPTDPAKAQNGMITQVQAIFRLKQQISKDASFTLREAPIVHAYTSDGIYGSGFGATAGKPVANPIFENDVWLIFDFAPPHGLVTFSFPFILESTRYRDFDPRAPHNGDWGNYLYVYPELTFVVQKNIFLGIAYESANLVNIQNTGTDPAVGSGTFHLVLRTSF